MDASLFAKMFSDKNLQSLKKMQYKYSADEVSEMLRILEQTMYRNFPLNDFSGKNIVYLDNIAQVRTPALKALFSSAYTGKYGLKAMEEEIHSTLVIENIQSSRDSVRKILSGYAPKDEMENRIFGMKKGIDFISDISNKITENNIFKLYSIAVREFPDNDDKLLLGRMYRHDSVFIVGNEVEHQGLDHNKLPLYMGQLVNFINSESNMNDLLKSAAIHFYIAYLHPYFDGNGRMARLIQLWYLVQQGFPAAMFIPFSSYISKTRKKYYDAYTLIEKNQEISGFIDITPFLTYFVENVYNQIGEIQGKTDTIGKFQQALADRKVTEKEDDLFEFILSAYGDSEFSTKQLEKDFGNAAYATIRSFVLKFEKLGILSSQSYGTRVKYRLSH
jgi:Fic family protein